MNGKVCVAQNGETCVGCTLTSSLMCRYDPRDSLHFFMIILTFFVASIGGVIASGYGWWLFGWIAYMFVFFFLWEARVLCSHCPYWAAEGRMLRCHANYGVIKLWRYRPEPMTRFEQAQFLLGVAIFIIYPLAFMMVGGQYLLAVIGLSSAVSFGYLLYRNICNRCVNFSCPLNHVTQTTREAFFARDPPLAQIWKQHMQTSGTVFSSAKRD